MPDILAYVRGVSKQVEVATSEALLVALAMAKGGEVIRLTQVVDPFRLRVKWRREAWVQVVLPRDQIVCTEFLAPELRVMVLGGTHSEDFVTGDPTGAGHYSVYAGGASHFVVAAAVLSQAVNNVFCENSSDFAILSCVNEWARSDCFQLQNCHRAIVDDIYGRDSVIVGKKMRFFADGRTPIDGVGDTSDPTIGWIDGAHADIGQIHSGSSHIVIARLDQHWDGQGVVSFSASANPYTHHIMMRDSDLRVNTPHGINLYGAHITVQDNHVGNHPNIEVDFDPRIVLSRGSKAPLGLGLPADGSGNPLQGGRNTIEAPGTIENPVASANGVAVDLAAAEINGDPNTELPVVPAFDMPSWFDDIVRPAYQPYTGAIELVVPHKIVFGHNDGGQHTFGVVSSSTVIKVGMFLTSNLGSTRGFPANPEQRQWRWLRDGVPIAGAAGVGDAARVYEITQADLDAASANGGQSLISIEQSIDNGPWVESSNKAFVKQAAAPAGEPTWSIKTTALSKPEGDTGLTRFDPIIARDDTSQAATIEWYATASNYGAEAPDPAVFDGGEYPSGTLNYAVGQAEATPPCDIIADEIDQADRVFDIKIRNPSIGNIDPTADTCLCTIENDDAAAPPEEFSDDFTGADGQLITDRPGWVQAFGAAGNFTISANRVTAAGANQNLILRDGTYSDTSQRVRMTWLATTRAAPALWAGGANGDEFTGIFPRLNTSGDALRFFHYDKGGLISSSVATVGGLTPLATNQLRAEIRTYHTPQGTVYDVYQEEAGEWVKKGSFTDTRAARPLAGAVGFGSISSGAGGFLDTWLDSGVYPIGSLPDNAAVVLWHLEQSEGVYITSDADAYQGLPMPDNIPEGNLVMVRHTADPVGSPKSLVAVSPATAATKAINPVSASVACILEFAHPGVNFCWIADCKSGTSRSTLYSDAKAVAKRNWADSMALLQAATDKYGPVNAVYERWHNSDAGSSLVYEEKFSPWWFGADADGNPIELGVYTETVDGNVVDHCITDVTGQGRGAVADTVQFTIGAPMPFNNGLSTGDPERANFSADSPTGEELRWIEPRRQLLRNIENGPNAQLLDFRIGPSSHALDFGGGIHPPTDRRGGVMLYGEPVAIELSRKAGNVIGEPTIMPDEVVWAPDGSYVDVPVSLPNGGPLVTVRTNEGMAAPAAPSPHQQEVVGFEIRRVASGLRRPVWRADAQRDAAFTGTVEIFNTGAGTPRRGIVRITPVEPFVSGDSISHLRGAAHAILLRPRDIDNELYYDMLREHDARYHDPSATYPYSGHPVPPYQVEIVMP